MIVRNVGRLTDVVDVGGPYSVVRVVDVDLGHTDLRAAVDALDRGSRRGDPGLGNGLVDHVSAEAAGHK